MQLKKSESKRKLSFCLDKLVDNRQKWPVYTGIYSSFSNYYFLITKL